MEAFKPRILRWLELRYRSGFSEWLSNVYYPEDASALLPQNKSLIVLDLMMAVSEKYRVPDVLKLLATDVTTARMENRQRRGIKLE